MLIIHCPEKLDAAYKAAMKFQDSSLRACVSRLETFACNISELKPGKTWADAEEHARTGRRDSPDDPWQYHFDPEHCQVHLFDDSASNPKDFSFFWRAHLRDTATGAYKKDAYMCGGLIFFGNQDEDRWSIHS